MKKFGRILVVIAIIVMMATGLCFADGTEGGLVLEDTYPKEDTSGAAIENFDVKLYFNNEMTEEALGDVNDNCFQLIDADGNVLPTIVLYSPKETGVVMVLFDYNTEKTDHEGKKITIKGNTEYTLKISGDLRDDQGNTLGKDKVIKFTTINQSRNSIVSMLLMLVLYAGIIGVSLRNAKKGAEKQAKEAKVNPYKEAKKTGKSVEEIVEKDQKRKEKIARKAAEDDDDDDYDDEEDYLEEGHYRVKTRRTVASGGSSYITGRKAEAEARAEREARYARNQAKQKKKVKGKGKKKYNSDLTLK